MPNESKIGMLAGVAVFLVVAVFFQGRPAAGTAFINNEAAPASPAAPATPDRTTPSVPPAGVSAPTTAAGHTTWTPREPREVKPVSRDPLLWP